MNNIRKATGYVDNPAKLLRLTPNELTPPISSLMNTLAMSPLYLKWYNSYKMNFRPVSILTGISKLSELSEYVANDQLLEFSLDHLMM